MTRGSNTAQIFGINKMSYTDEDFNAWSGLLVGIPSAINDLGTNSSTNSRATTPAASVSLVGATSAEPTSFWDTIGGALNSVGATQLINRYVNEKITKEAINDGVPLYTTYGNPSDQPNGKLLSDVATQTNQQQRYWLYGAMIFAGVAVVYLIARK